MPGSGAALTPAMRRPGPAADSDSISEVNGRAEEATNSGSQCLASNGATGDAAVIFKATSVRGGSAILSRAAATAARRLRINGGFNATQTLPQRGAEALAAGPVGSHYELPGGGRGR